MASAIRHHQAGRIEQAAALYRSILESEPERCDALNLLGVAMSQQGMKEAAIDLIGRAVALNPAFAEAHGNLGNVLKSQGRLEEAVVSYRKSIALEPDYAPVYYNLGNALKNQGKLDEAAATYRKAIAVAPDFVEAHDSLAHTCNRLGRLEDAVASYRRVVALRPEFAEAHSNLGSALTELGEHDEAVACHRKAIALKPSFAEAYSNLGLALSNDGKLDDAVASYRKAISLKPEYAAAHTNLGSALRAMARLDEAIDCHRKAIVLKPKYALAHYNLGVALRDQGNMDGSLDAFDRALAIDSGCDAAQTGKTLVYLLQGNFAAGWPGYLARESMSRMDPRFHREPLAPDLSGKRVVVARDQGLGDELFFLRFVPLCKARGASIAYAADPKIATMIERLPFIDQVVGRDNGVGVFDLALSVGDLPYLLGVTRMCDTPPPVTLPVLPDRKAEMRRRLDGIGPPPYIGVTWRGGIQKRHHLSKIFPLERGANALRSVSGTVIILQRNPAAGEIDRFARELGREVQDFTALNDDLEGMLALVDLLDDYVCVSNTNFHLRVARGRTSRVLVPSPPEFRWMAEGEESPWYPGARVYRQTMDGGWDPAFADLAGDLAAAWPVS